MRLGQISRKLNIRPIQIRDFIREKFQVEIDTDLNTKLEDNYIEALQKKFDTAPQGDLLSQATSKVAGAEAGAVAKEKVQALKQVQSNTSEEEQEDRWSKKAAELIKAKKEAANKTATEENTSVEIIVEEEQSTPVVAEVKMQADEKVEEKSEPISVENNQNDGLDPFTPRRVDPDAELIKAVNIKLDGPKVIGKIVLPPSKKELEAAAAEAKAREAELVAEAVAVAETDTTIEVSEDGTIENEIPVETPISLEPVAKPKQLKSDPISKKMASLQGLDSDEEWSPFKDKNGIYHFSREQKQNRQKSLERLKSSKKEDQKKRAKSSYYEQNFKPEPKEVIAKKKEKKETVSKKTKPAEKPVRKGVWGKFMNWLND